jgi:protein SCO1/2
MSDFQKIPSLLSFYCAFSNHINFILLGFKPKKTLPIYNPADVNPELVDSTVQYISKYHTIADFIYQSKRKTITQKDYEGKIYVADFSLQRVVLFVQK